MLLPYKFCEVIQRLFKTVKSLRSKFQLICCGIHDDRATRTKLRNCTASAADTHYLARRMNLPSSVIRYTERLRVTKKEKSILGNPFRELTLPCIMQLYFVILAKKG